LPASHRDKNLESLRRILDNQIKLDDKDFNRLKFLHDIGGTKGKGKNNKAASAPKEAAPAAPGVAQADKGSKKKGHDKTDDAAGKGKAKSAAKATPKAKSAGGSASAGSDQSSTGTGKGTGKPKPIADDDLLPSAGPKGSDTCVNSILGTCQAGDDCARWHPLKGTNYKKVCGFFQFASRGCNKGSDCKDAHIAIGPFAAKKVIERARSESAEKRAAAKKKS
jgi:hypothetical protein